MFLHGYNIGVSKEGYTYVSCDHNEQYPLLISVNSIGNELFNIDYPKPGAADYIFKIRTESNNIYKNSVVDTKEYFGIQSFWIYPEYFFYENAMLLYNKKSKLKEINREHHHYQLYNEYFHSECHALYTVWSLLASQSYSEQLQDSLLIKVGIYNTDELGKKSKKLETISLYTIHNSDSLSLPKPQAMRWFTNCKQLGVMICSDTVIPTSKSFVQVHRSNFVTNIDIKFGDVVDVNSYLFKNFTGRKLKWKGFSNSSYGFVAMFENLDNNYQNILIRYNNQNQQFSTTTLDTSIDCRSIFLDSLGALVLAGTKKNNDKNDFYIGYYNSNGILFEKVWGGEDYNRLNDVIIDSFGEIAVSGQKGNDLYLAKFTFTP